MKGYRLWCPYSKFSKFLISKDVTFNESAILNLRKEQFNVENNSNVRENMEFVSKALRIIEGNISTKSKEKRKYDILMIKKIHHKNNNIVWPKIE